MNLLKLRSEINKVDNKIIVLLAKRQSFMSVMGIYKRRHDIAIYQPQREREILAKLENLAAKKKLDSLLIQKVFKAIFKNSKDIQRHV